MTNRIANQFPADRGTPRGSQWQCRCCKTIAITEPGGPAPRCTRNDLHGFMDYRGGKWIGPDDKVISVKLSKSHDTYQ